MAQNKVDINIQKAVDLYVYYLDHAWMKGDTEFKVAVIRAVEKPKTYTVLRGQDLHPVHSRCFIKKDEIGRMSDDYDSVVVLTERDDEKAGELFRECLRYKRSRIEDQLHVMDLKIAAVDAGAVFAKDGDRG